MKHTEIGTDDTTVALPLLDKGRVSSEERSELLLLALCWESRAIEGLSLDLR